MADVKRHDKVPKTNAARLLDKLGVAYQLHRTEVDANDLSAVGMAEKLGVAPAKVFKTLVALGDRTGPIMACIGANRELDLKALAKLSGNKHVEMAPLKAVQPLTGYVRGGCSPLAAKKAYPVYLDQDALSYEQIFISAGLRGMQIELSPEDLIRAANATVGAIAKAADISS